MGLVLILIRIPRGSFDYLHLYMVMKVGKPYLLQTPGVLNRPKKVDENATFSKAIGLDQHSEFRIIGGPILHFQRLSNEV
jgi:hypothetical protein